MFSKLNMDGSNAVSSPDAPANLRGAAQAMAAAFGSDLPVGYLTGKTQMRDFLLENFALSCVEAEALVDELEASGEIVFKGDPGQADHIAAVWEFAC